MRVLGVFSGIDVIERTATQSLLPMGKKETRIVQFRMRLASRPRTWTRNVRGAAAAAATAAASMP
jgi:hypothetical protein